ncbi:hypothetical protein M514_01135 [Trichuris suis]|uniref:RING-type domain-containing protein n=1 Tax=Trichuris suis TaxID=68888 RepID=A0A085NN78_9BILA|nr:hypothetical protein M513_01135 [Trichuris suis]KFD70924.1 hypothetical protein M514_01135 [Trichuris suis]KHJ45768.1 RING-box protein 1A family protein [Trichuris suis]
MSESSQSEDAEAEANGEQSLPTTNNNETKPRFQIKKWNVVAMWSWDTNADNCAICRNHIMEVCIQCQVAQDTDEEGNKTKEECTVAWGECNHAFHLHCISRWLKTRNVCPLDNLEWKYKKRGSEEQK